MTNAAMAGPHPADAKEAYLRTIFRKCIAAVVASHGVHIGRKAFELIVLLTEERMQTLYEHLGTILRMQRRRQPNIEDLALLFTLHNVNICELEYEKHLQSRQTQALQMLRADPELEPLAPSAAPFFEISSADIKQIVPSRRKRPQYIPKWCPQLPPDHTYMNTPMYTNHIRDLRQLRERLVEEGCYAERALQRLLGTKGSSSTIQLVEPPNSLAQLHSELDEGYIKVLDPSTAGGALEPGAAGQGDTPENKDTETSSVRAQEEPQAIPSRSSPDASASASPTAAAVTGAAEVNGLAHEAGEPSEGVAVKTEEEPVSGSQNGVGKAAADDASDKLVPKLRLKMLSSGAKSDKTVKLRLSLGKRTANSKIANPFGKRPRVDIVELARQGIVVAPQRSQAIREPRKSAFENASMESLLVTAVSALSPAEESD